MLFTEDGCLIQGNGDEVQGHEELYAFASEEFVQAFPETAHIVTNPLIQVNGDEATGEWYLFLLYKDADGEKDWTQAKYDDEYRKVKKGWRIARSRVDYGVQ